MTLAVHGIGVSRGVAIGKAHVAERHRLEISQHAIVSDQVEREVQRFRLAVSEARKELRDIRNRVPASTPAEILEFIDAHTLMLEDNTLTDPPAQMIRENECNAEWALQVHRNRLAAVFDDMEDPYLASRMEDVDQVVGRIQRHLRSADEGDASHDYQGIILVADDLAPADLTLLHHEGLAGLVTEFGGPLSHTAILARSLKIPAAMGVRHARQLIREGEQLIVDGGRGIVLADAGRAIRGFYRGKLQEFTARQIELRQVGSKRSQTRCGEAVKLQVNIDIPGDIDQIRDIDAQGVGLYRTEFLFMNRAESPGEEEQYEAYLQLIKGMDGRPVTIRTLDLGADKQPNGRPSRTGVPLNPAMGLRAVRLCLADQALFIPQLRAIVRAAAHGDVKMLVPMFSTAQELFQVRNLLKSVIRDLRREGHDVPEDIPLGGMIEVPAAAIAVATFAKYLDFLSIGTNDLIQYTLAIDRIDDSVSHLYDPVHPAILKLLSMIIDACQKADTPLSMCGEMAGDPLMTRLLLGMGLRDFSMHPGNFLEVKQAVVTTDLKATASVVRRILRATNPIRIRTLLRELNEAGVE